MSIVGAAVQWACSSMRVVWAALVALFSVMHEGWRATSVVRQGTGQVGQQVSQPHLFHPPRADEMSDPEVQGHHPPSHLYIRTETQGCSEDHPLKRIASWSIQHFFTAERVTDPGVGHLCVMH